MPIVKNPFADMEMEDKMPVKKGIGKVIINLEIYKTIITSLTRYSNPLIPHDQWIEVMGLLYGYNEKDNVIITEAVPFTHTKKEGHILKVQFDEADYALAADLETNEFNTRSPPQFIVGWFHSHPGIKVMLSQDDITNQLAWQTNNPLAIALVFNHERLLKQIEEPKNKGDQPEKLVNDPGFKCFRLEDVRRGIEGNYDEIEYEFSDFKVDKLFIQNAQEFCIWTAYAFPRGDEFVTKYQKIFQDNIQKLTEIYNGTKNYVDTLKRKNENNRIPELVENQMKEARRIINHGNHLRRIINMLRKYLEYKEREHLVPMLENALKEWEKTSEIYTQLSNLKN